MPGRATRTLPVKPFAWPPALALKASGIEQLNKEIAAARADLAAVEAEIADRDKVSIETIQSYRSQIDDVTSKWHEVGHKIEDALRERDETATRLREQNEEAKRGVAQEDQEVCNEIDSTRRALEVIRQFEIDRETIAGEIHQRERQIETELRVHEEQMETVKKLTADLAERNVRTTEETLARECEAHYEYLLRTTDRGVLLHIQKRNNFEADLQSLGEMGRDYEAKIADLREGNARLREAIAGMKADEVINRGAELRSRLQAARQEVAAEKASLEKLREKVRRDREAAETARTAEAKKVELDLKVQEDQLNHKLAQIDALRELTLSVLSFRSQLEAELITALGEVLADVQGRLGSDSSVMHCLSRMTMEERAAVIERFMERVHVSTESPRSERILSPLPETGTDQRPAST